MNHINSIKSDNNIQNLEWCTQSENIKHAYATGLSTGHCLNGEENGASKIILDTQTGIYYFGVREAAESKGISKIQLGKKLRNERKNNSSFLFV